MSKKNPESKEEIVDYESYSEEVQEDIEAIQNKLNSLQSKLVSLEIKEQIINNIITRTNATLESIDPKNFKWIGQTQSNLMKQIESLGLVKDIVIKYEDMILKYRKMLNDIKERKINNRLKLANLFKESEEKETNVAMVLEEVQGLLASQNIGSNGTSTINTTGENQDSSNEDNPFLNEIIKELKEENY